MNDLWVDKYRPDKIDNILLPFNSLTKIKQWIKDFEKNKNKVLLLHGSPGVGKTTLANIILKEYNYDIIEFNTSEVRNQKLIKDKLNSIFNKKNILSMMNNEKQIIGIIMDEMDGISSGERSGITEFINLINPKKNKFNNPIICTTNSIAEKKMKEVMKYTITIKINSPTRKELMILIDRIQENEGFEILEETKLKIIKKSQNDFRRMVTLLQYVFEYSNNNNIDELIDNYSEKNIDMGLFESVQKIINKYNTEDILHIYNSDKNLISMLVYENFLYEIVYNTNENYSKKIANISKIYDNFSIADNLDSHIMIDHKFILSNYCGNYKCVITSFLINNMKKYKFKKHSDILFSKLLNKSSLEYLNAKNLEIINNAFSIQCASQIHQILADFILFLFSKENLKQKGIDILNHYKYDIKKIDKIANITYDKEKWKKIVTQLKK